MFKYMKIVLRTYKLCALLRVVMQATHTSDAQDGVVCRVDDMQRNALMHACVNGHTKVVELLLSLCQAQDIGCVGARVCVPFSPAVT